MTRRLLLLMVASLAVATSLGVATSLAVVSVPLSAHPGHEHRILGTVTMAAADHVMVKDRAGKVFTVYLAPTTKVLRDKKPAQVSEITAGMRVVVVAVTEEKDKVERLVAKQIDLGAAPAVK
jgi:hypothetical protein